MSDEIMVPVSVLNNLADTFERDAQGNDGAKDAAEEPRMKGHFAGKADAYRTAAKRLREYADGAERDA